MSLWRVVVSLVLLAILSGCKHQVEASPGDRSPEFQRRVASCREDCPPLDFELWLTSWDCLSNCKYLVMREITEERIAGGKEVLQYHGKWPFVRILGMQEPASVLFSLANLVAHVVCLKRFLGGTSPNTRLRFMWVVYSLVALNTWLWSAVYHTRDFPVTEKLDYFSATFSVGFATFCAAVRVFSLGWRQARILLAVMLLLFVRHCWFLTFDHFDYGYNLVATIAVGLTGNIFWLIWYARNRGSPYGWKLILATLYLFGFMLLEVGDFPPLFDLLDAHAIWHASTVPWALLWNSFVIDDTNYQDESRTKNT